MIKGKIDLLAGKTIAELLSEHKKYLFEDYIPFIEQYIYDKKYGGFKCNSTYFGENLNTTKRTWYDARGVWVYSYLYHNIVQKKEYLQIAEKTVSLLLSVNDDIEELWPWSYKEDGSHKTGGHPDIYGNLFVAEALSMYSVASENEEYWDISKKILVHCVQMYKEVSYKYTLEYTPDPSFPTADVVLGHWMIMLRVCTGLLRAKEDLEIKAIADRCVEALMESHYQPSSQLMLEILNRDMLPVAGGISQFVYIGHAIESLWMVMDEARRRNDQKLFDTAAERFRRHVEVAWDDVYDGVFHCLDNVEMNKWNLNKVLWAHHEVMIGLMILIEEQQNLWAMDFYNKMYNFMKKKFVQESVPYRPWKIGGDRHMYITGVGTRIENYHHPRYLMFSIEFLRKLR